MPVAHVQHGPKQSVDVGVRSTEQFVDIIIISFNIKNIMLISIFLGGTFI